MKRLALALALTATGAAAQEAPGLQAAMAAMRSQIRACWLVVPGSAAAQTVVTLGVAMNPDGTVRADGLTVVAGDGPDVEAAEAAARRALLRCQGQGYPLPDAEYGTWKYIEIRFDPEDMRAS